MATEKQDQPDTRSKDEIRREIDAAANRISDNLAGLVAEVHPKAVVNRTVVDAQDFAKDQFQQAKSQVKDEYGWRVDRLAIAAGAVVGLVTFVLVIRSLTNRGKSS
mgnify:CR=1 FL=1